MIKPIAYAMGTALSSLLLKLIMDQILKKVKTRVQMERKELKIICYADHAIIMAENENDFQ